MDIATLGPIIGVVSALFLAGWRLKSILHERDREIIRRCTAQYKEAMAAVLAVSERLHTLDKKAIGHYATQEDLDRIRAQFSREVDTIKADMQIKIDAQSARIASDFGVINDLIQKVVKAFVRSQK